MPETENKKDLSLETVDLGQKGNKEPNSSSASGSMPNIEAGSYFAGYRIIKKIAHGAMGVVYLAEDLKLKRKIAIKVILTAPGMQATEEQTNRFLREAQAIAKLRHKRIVPVYSVDVFEGCQYFTMEYIEGPTLEQYLQKNEVTAAKAVEIVLGIAEGLQEAHEKNIVHRDIKPANIMMQNGESPMITDFGLAKILENEQKLTMTGSMLGTPCYMSPEQARGDADLDHRSDVFSLGVLLYEMVTEKLPFKGESYMKTVLKVIEGDYVKPRKIKPRLSRDVESIIKKALEKDREFRYENMIDFIDDCTRFQRGEVVTISRSGIYRKIYRDIVRQRYSILMSIAIIIIIGYLMLKNIDQSQTVDVQIREREIASAEKEIAAREKEKISREKQQLEIQGELLKKGSTSPEFNERFENEQFFAKNWFTSWQPVIVKKGVAEIPASKNLHIIPKPEGFSSSAIFSWKMKIPTGNRFVFFCGKSNAPDKSIDRPVFIIFQINKTPEKENRRNLRVYFYQIHNKTIPDKTNFNINDILGTQAPLAVKFFDLPENVGESLNFSVKRHETFYEIEIKEKDGIYLENDRSFREIFKVSSASYLNPYSLQCGFLIPESNKFSMDLERFRVDKWIPGTSEIEINRIIESGKNDPKVYYSLLEKHVDRLETAIMVSDNENSAENVNFKYQFAKASFLMGVALHRNLGLQTSEADRKLIADNYEKALVFAEEYMELNERSNKTEYVNYEDLYLSVLVQSAFLNIYLGDFNKAIEMIRQYQNYTLDKTPYRNWLWNLPESIEKYFAFIKPPNKLKGLIDLHPFLKQFSYASEAGDQSDIKRLYKDLLKDTLEVLDFELFEKYVYLNFEESSKSILQEFISKEISKEKIHSLNILMAIKTVNKVYKFDEVHAISNYKFEKWSMMYPDKETRSLGEYWDGLRSRTLITNVVKAFPEFGSAVNQNVDQGVEALNGLIENESFRRKVIATIIDSYLIERFKANKEGIQHFGEVFPVNLSIDQNRGGNINVSLDDDGLRIRIITKDNELKNKFAGNMVSQGDNWSLYFDFRQGQNFLSNQPGPGLFKLTYAPVLNENGEVRFVFDDKNSSPKLKVINFTSTNHIMPTNEVLFLLPYSEIYRVTNGINLKYMGFNATLNLENKEKMDSVVLFEKDSKKVFYLTKKANVKTEPLLNEADKDLINELVNVYQRVGDSYVDKIMMKKIFDNWLGVSTPKPLLNNTQIEKICQDFLTNIIENTKRNLVKKVVDDANLFFSVKGLLAGVTGQPIWKDEFLSKVAGRVISSLDQHLTLIEKRNKTPGVLDGEGLLEVLKRARISLKFASPSARKEYWRFTEKFLSYFKENQPEIFDAARSFYIQLPENENNFREKAIASMMNGMVSEALFYLKKHLESDYWKDDERAWFEYQLASKYASFLGLDIRLSDEDLKEKSKYFASLSRNIEVDCGLVLEKRMKINEFLAKYPLSENINKLINLLIVDLNGTKKNDEIKVGYETILKAPISPWLASMIKRRVSDLQKQ